MSNLNELSLADLKAATDYVEKLKGERLEDIKRQGISSKDDSTFIGLDKLGHNIHSNLFNRLMKLKNS